MLTQPTIDKLQALHLTAMAQAFDQQRGSAAHAELHFEDRFGLLVDAEWTAREQRRLTQRLRNARLRYPASLEDVDFTTPRGLSRDVVLSLATGGWIRDHHNLLITGPTGIGKSWLASAEPEFFHRMFAVRGGSPGSTLALTWTGPRNLVLDHQEEEAGEMSAK